VTKEKDIVVLTKYVNTTKMQWQSRDFWG